MKANAISADALPALDGRDRQCVGSFSEGESDSSAYAVEMQAAQPLVHRRDFVPAAVDSKTANFSGDTRHDCLVKSTAQTEEPMPTKASKRNAARLNGVLPQPQHLAKRESFRIALRTKGRVLFTETAEIVSVHAVGNYASLNVRSSSYLVRESLSSIAAKLKPCGFIRTGRSLLVNGALVEEIWPLPTGDYRLRVRDGKEYTLTRIYRDNLRYLAILWLGPERSFNSASARGDTR